MTLITRFVHDLSRFIFLICLLSTSKILVHAYAGRCYLCSQSTLAECVGSIHTDSILFHTVLQYYTEPCNGQCILFRNHAGSTIRGCSWTYGHMTSKPTGWHELSPGIRAYFCDSYLCNNGTYEQPEGTPMLPLPLPLPIEQGNVLLNPIETINNPQQMFVHGGLTQYNIPVVKEAPRQLRQCYVCTSREMGCSEHLDPRFASKYIQPCPSSCIVFRNPTDHNLITRDCASAWPDVHAKSGLHKVLGSDAFFCQESLCNGIGFDFIMGIFHNQLPAVITFPPTESIDDRSTIVVNPIDPMTTSSPLSETDPIVTEDEQVAWEDPDLDFVIVEATTPVTITTTTTMTTPPSTSIPLLPIEFPLDGFEFEYQSTAVPPESFLHLQFIENIPASSTIAGGAAIAEDNSQLNWWELDEMTFPSITEPIPSSFSTVPPNHISDDYDWTVFNTTSIPNPSMNFNMNDLFPFPFDASTPSLNLLNSDNSPFSFDKPSPTLAIPPFAWMLHLATQNQAQRSSTMKTKLKKRKTVDVKKIFAKNLDHFHDYCENKQCQHGGRLNADCLCICLPAFSGNNCERINCEKEPAHICDFVLEDECKNESIRYLCPKFCQLNLCSA